MQRLEQRALCVWQLYVGTVTALEALGIYLHLLTLEAWRYAAAEDYHVGISRLLQQRLLRELRLVGDVKLQVGHAAQLQVIYLYLIRLAGLDFVVLATLLHTVRRSEAIDDGIAVDDDAQAVVSLCAYMHRSIGLRTERALVASGEVLQLYAGGKDGVAAVVLHYRGGETRLCYRLTLLCGVVEVFCRHALLTVREYLREV